ncbi:hypothetical protein CACET_c38130 [Clostridium aceticum]|uniref:Uncharacterized protein n=1 Tax=Clostridium aceticum TaxID=84022 RepID=A0A0D8I7K6_9CLOT|nr:hypothetical protein [Clostridium aceticum]AKL97241.1 hypothetical protein CACET_c38130 [Clostridium aceticum]KJF26270.1 hypothetical protein TZ02_13910 [Clostridium aceticum]
MKQIKTFLLVMVVFLLLSVPVYAHKMMIEPIESGIVRVIYADGSFSERTEVVAYNANNEEVFRGQLDTDGYFYYDENDSVAYLVADDGLGHMVTWNIGDPVATTSSRGKWLRIAAIIFVFIGISLVFHFRKKRSSAKA